MLFYLLHLDELETINPAALLAVVSSAASVTSPLVVVHRLEKRVRNGQAAVPSRMTVVGVPLIFLTCAILAFIVFLVGIKFTTLEN
ncbi:hypothetical protein LXA43DRAFT_62061 [Ganoderma leucocontextum]|nr:hypothetical protein LXA43DRAFT_62061 [Ganoderma leucocontextum]